tara:strand:- start:1269 stop:2153 length:885 start_codon:yes stop_codon:yes gene_type:complete
MNKSNISCKFNNISGDEKLNFVKKIYWILVSILNFVLSIFDMTDKRIKLIKFNNINKINFIKKNESPSRILSDLFWLNFPWEKNKKALKKKFSIIEIGCGSGKYGFFLKKILKKNFQNYLGLDINLKKTFSKKEKNIKFLHSDCYNVHKFLTNKNLIITQSAIEHFKEDLKFFKSIKKSISKKKIIQIHLMPSYGCLLTYLWHGYRHYNLKSISNITRIFDKNSDFKLYALGSNKLNWFHFWNITIKKNKDPKLRNRNKRYFKKLKFLIEENFFSNEISNPSFYALVIYHNFKK